MRIRRFTQAGLKAFGEYLDLLKEDPSGPIPTELLEDDIYSERLDGPVVEIEDVRFENRYEAAAYLNQKLLQIEAVLDVLHDAELWAWLTLFYFEQVCPVNNHGLRKRGELVRYIPNIRDYRKYYRHLLAGPYRIYRAHRQAPQRTQAILAGKLHKAGDVFEQIASVQGILTAPGAMEAVNKLYYNYSQKKVKSGAGGKRPGSARRLRDFLNQIDLTWDLYSISSEDLLVLLPAEFDKFKPLDSGSV